MAFDKRLTTLCTLSGLLAESDRLEDILNMALEMVANVMEMEVVLLYSLNSESRELVLLAYRGVPLEFAQGVERLKLGEGFNGQVAETGEPMLVSNVISDPRLSREVVREENIQAQLIVPMKSLGQVVGTICVAARYKREFPPEEIELLTAIGNEIGIAIDKRRLYQKQLAMTEQLQCSEANYRDLFQNASDAITVNDLNGNIIAANKATERKSGYNLEELLRMNVVQFLDGNARSLARTVKSKLLRDELVETPYEQRFIKKDGTETIIELTTRLITQNGQPVAFQNIGRDVTEERKMRDNMRFYLQKVLVAQEEERKRIARELHDDATQSLLLLIRRLDTITSDPQNKLSKSVKEKLTGVQSLAVETVNALRRYAQELRPAILDDMGLIAALEWMAENLNQEHGIKTSVEVYGAKRELLPETKLELFRIAQEALSNARRHAKASAVSVKLDYGAEKITMTIADDGSGFKLPQRLGDLPRTGRLGLTGMRERARLLGGSMTVQSETGKGTIIIVEAPIQATEDIGSHKDYPGSAPG